MLKALASFVAWQAISAAPKQKKNLGPGRLETFARRNKACFSWSCAGQFYGSSTAVMFKARDHGALFVAGRVSGNERWS